MRWSFVVLTMVVACGRVGFQPLVDGNVATSGGDSGDGGSGTPTTVASAMAHGRSTPRRRRARPRSTRRSAWS